MKDNKLFYVFGALAIIIIIVGFWYINQLKEKQVNSEIVEYIPQEEIAEEQMRKTMIELYFYNNEKGELEKEARVIDSKELIERPYEKLIDLLIQGPKSEKLKTIIPEGTKELKTELNGDCLTVDMSIEFMNYTEDEDLKNKMIYSIVNTLTQFTEVDSVQFLINGEKNSEFSEKYVKI